MELDKVTLKNKTKNLLEIKFCNMHVLEKIRKVILVASAVAEQAKSLTVMVHLPKVIGHMAGQIDINLPSLVIISQNYQMNLFEESDV